MKWRGYGHEHNTWEPEDNLSHCQETLQVYEQQRTDREGREEAAHPTTMAQEQPEPEVQEKPSAIAQRIRGRGTFKKGIRKSKRVGRPTAQRW